MEKLKQISFPFPLMPLNRDAASSQYKAIYCEVTALSLWTETEITREFEV